MGIVHARALPLGVELSVPDRPARKIVVDTTEHALVVTLPDDTVYELGALRSGFLAMLEIARAHLGAFTPRDRADGGDAQNVLDLDLDVTRIAPALYAALVRAADARRARTNDEHAVQRGIAEISQTPVTLSAPFLGAEFVQKDALQFRACRVAIANAEDLWIEEDTPETAEKVCEALGKWRNLFAAATGKKANKAVNHVLHEFGEVLPAAALWGLRNVHLTRPHESRAHVELLGWLGAITHGDDADTLRAVVERADAADVVAVLDGKDPRGLAHLLAHGERASTSLRELVASAQASFADAHQGVPLARPALALPNIPGVRFIATVEELRREGDEMHHCVYTLKGACRAGRAFIFHTDVEGERATTEIDSRGRVVQSRGPCNAVNGAAHYASRELARWGAQMWTSAFDPNRLCFPPGLAAPPGAVPLMNVRRALEAYERLRPGAPFSITAWFQRAIGAAVHGRVGLVAESAGDPPQVYALAPDGAFLGDTRTLAFTLAPAPTPQFSLDDFPIPEATRPARPLRGIARAVRLRVIREEWAARQAPADARGDAPGDGAGPAAGLQRARFEDAPTPLPPPEIHGVTALVTAADWAHTPFARRTRDVERVYFACRPERGAILVEVNVPTGEVTAIEREIATPEDVAWSVEQVRKWARGLWAVRLGLATSTWRGTMRAPVGTEPLGTVEECYRVYRRTADTRYDPDGALARFFETHVNAAARGRAWLVVRDRLAGLVSVMDDRRRPIARTEDVLAR